MTGDQFRAARALLDLSTRDLAKELKCSAMAITKLERGALSNGRLWLRAYTFYSIKGLAFYAGGVIRSGNRTMQDYADPLRNRLMAGKSGSAYVLAFDRIVEAASDHEKS